MPQNIYFYPFMHISSEIKLFFLLRAQKQPKDANQHALLVLQCIRAPPRRGRYWEIHPRCPKDFPRPERFPEGEARGKSRGSREIWRAEGMDFPIPPEFWWSTDNLSASIFLQGVDQKILPCGQGRIDSVKINPSLLMMTD